MTGAATANVRERRLTIHQVNRLIGLLARHLEALHQIKMPQRYWMGLLYWYAREAIDKQEQFLSLTIPPQYDGSSTKSHVLQRANPRLNRTFLNNLIDFQKFESYGKSWRMIRVLIPVLRELLHYGVFRIKNFRKRQTLRWKLNRSAIESRDPLLRQALRLMPEHLVEDFSFFQRWVTDCEKPIDSRKLKNGLSVAIMNLLKKDKPIKLYQHGAFYGELKYHDACVLERRIADEFYTWGWADPARRWSSPAVPMRTPIKDTSIQHANSKFHVCLVLPSIFEIEIHGFIFQQLVSDLNRAGINPLVRVRPATVENMEPEFLQSLQSVGDLSLDCDSGSKFTDILDSSGIFVFIEHPSTAFLEALRACRPSLVLVRNIHEYLPSYRCHLKALGNLKIAYSSVPSLRQRIKALDVSDPARTIDPWWSEVTSDRSFLDFRLNYCRF